MPLVGGNEFKKTLQKLVAQTDLAARTIVSTIGARIVAETHRNFEGSHPKGQPHVGGDRPNVVTGYLRRSIRMTPVVRVGLTFYKASVGPNAVYGRRVELGYLGSRGYPYFRPAVAKVTPEIYAESARIWRRYIGV